MKTLSLIITLNSILLTSFGQVSFEKGYFINNENQRIECLIKNYDQKNNPKGIEYKTAENSEIQKAEINAIKAFGILNDSKFIRAETNIDRSSNDLAKPSETSSPEWSHEQMFLKVLVEGKASLFSYKDKTTSRFFYSVNDSTVKQLIYKEYLSEDRKYLLTNYGFRQQLWTEIKCENASISSVEKIQYSESALKKYFSRYNDCNNTVNKDYSSKKNKKPFHFKINSGFTLTSASFASDDPLRSTDFDTELDYRPGIEIEFVLPVNKNKWRVVLEPSYQHYSSQSENFLGSAEIDYHSLEFPLGLRYYIFINDKLNIFVNGLFVINSGINFDSEITLGYPYAAPVIIDPISCLAFGIGLNYKRLSSEIRYNTPSNIVSGYTYGSEFNVTSFIVGYRIF